IFKFSNKTSSQIQIFWRKIFTFEEKTSLFKIYLTNADVCNSKKSKATIIVHNFLIFNKLASTRFKKSKNKVVSRADEFRPASQGHANLMIQQVEMGRIQLYVVWESESRKL
uniref:Uncharacterized protein n=1 Tax=Romanomermis culicivorax TaxID=13658 RepID=A0A915KVC9_ROMCU